MQSLHEIPVFNFDRTGKFPSLGPVGEDLGLGEQGMSLIFLLQ